MEIYGDIVGQLERERDGLLRKVQKLNGAINGMQSLMNGHEPTLRGNGQIRAEDAILKVLRLNSEPMHPKEVWRETKKLGCSNKRTSINTMLSELFRRGLVERPREAAYTIK